MGIRHLIMALLSLAVMACMYNRMVLNLALITMTYHEHLDDEPNKTVHVEHCPHPPNFKDDRIVSSDVPMMVSVSDVAVAPIPISSVGILEHLRHKKFSWTQQTQGQLLGCFFWTNALFQIAAALIVQKYGCRWMLVVCVFASGIISLVSPFAAEYLWLFMLSRSILGLVQAGLLPAAFQAVCDWAPTNERSVLFSIIEFFLFGGSILAFFTSGIVEKFLGWPFAFFIPGVLGLTIAIPLAILYRNKPSNHPFVKEKELKLIQEDQPIVDTKSEPKLRDTPFKKILTNKAVIATAIYQFQDNWNTTVISAKIPVYLSEVLHVDIITNGQITATYCLLTGLVLPIAGYLGEKFIQTNYLSRTNSRKAFSIISGFMNAVFMFVIPLAGCNLYLVSGSIFLQAICSGFSTASDVPLPAEMTRNYPAFVYSIFNTLVMQGGFLAPLMAGIVLDTFTDKWMAWTFIFQYCAAQTTIGTIIFILFASADRQDFDLTPDELSRRKSGQKIDDDDMYLGDFKVQVARRSSISRF